MVKKTDKKSSKVKVGKLSVKKETVKDLKGEEMKKVKGGLLVEPETLKCARTRACASQAVCKTDVCATDLCK